MHEDWGSRCERWAGVRSEVIDVRGTDVHTMRAGDDHDGLPILLVHGLAGSASNWLEVMPGLAERRPVLAMDLPGFGRTRPPRKEAARVTANARFLRALLDRLGWDEVEVHGNSMGGMISVMLAANEPDRVRRLVLSSPALSSSRRDVAQLERTTFLQFAPFLVQGVGERLLQRVYSRSTPQELYDQTADYLHADPTRVSPELGEVSLENVQWGREQDWRLPAFTVATNSIVRAVTTRRRLEQAICSVAAPTLVLWGDRDRLIGAPVIDRVAALRPDWRIEVLDDIGHVAMFEAPQRYLDLVGAWRDENLGTQPA